VSNQKYTHLHDDLDAFIEQLRVFFLSETSAKYAAKLHVQLQSKSQEIDVFDCLIAAIIITNDYKIIITKNKKHFMRIGLLKVLSF
jgi:predicted nucleic acid-binding protein